MKLYPHFRYSHVENLILIWKKFFNKWNWKYLICTYNHKLTMHWLPLPHNVIIITWYIMKIICNQSRKGFWSFFGHMNKLCIIFFSLLITKKSCHNFINNINWKKLIIIDGDSIISLWSSTERNIKIKRLIHIFSFSSSSFLSR